MQAVQPLWKTVWRFLKTLKIELPYNPAIAILGIYPRDTGMVFRRDTCTPMFIAALSTIAKLGALLHKAKFKMLRGCFIFGTQLEWKVRVL